MSVEGDLVLGVDSSTTACKVFAYDAGGNVHAEGRAPIPLDNPSSGAWQQDAESWWRAFCEASRACVALVDPARLRGLAMANQRETFVVTDEAGTPLAPALVWMDHRCGAEVAHAASVLGDDRLHDLTGKPPCTTPSVYKWLGQRARAPELASRVRKVLDVHAFLTWRLTGRAVTSLAAADPMGLVDMRQRTWADDVVRLAGLSREQLPELVEVGSSMGTVSAMAAAQSGLPEGLAVVAGAGDGQAAGLGAGITAPGIAYLNLGTAVVSGVLSPVYVRDRVCRTLFGAIPGSYVLETDLQGGTFTVTWLCEKLLGRSLAALDELERGACGIAAGSDGVMLVPYWNGVMNPYWDEGASGIVVGLRGEHGQAHLYRALLEGIAFEQRLHTSGVEALAGRVREIVVMGGGSGSDLWCQILADVLGKVVVRAASHEATSLGAAMIAAVSTGLAPSFEAAAQAMSRRGERFEPGPMALTYERLYESKYRRLYPALRDVLLAK